MKMHKKIEELSNSVILKSKYIAINLKNFLSKMPAWIKGLSTILTILSIILGGVYAFKDKLFPSSDKIAIKESEGSNQLSACGITAALKDVPNLENKPLHSALPLSPQENIKNFGFAYQKIDLIMGGNGSYTIQDIYVENVEELDNDNISFIEAGLGCGAAGYSKISVDFNLDKGSFIFTDMSDPSNPQKTDYVPPVSVIEGSNAHIIATLSSCQKSRRFDLTIKYMDNRSKKSNTYTIEDIEIYAPEENSISYKINNDIKNPVIQKTDSSNLTRCESIIN